MTYSINDIEQLALANLSPEERDVLADRLWRSVHGDETDATEDPEFLAELERRVKSIEDGTAKMYSKQEVDAYLKQKYGWN